jgi:hypothetical protein
MICSFNTKFKKWTPIKITKEKVSSKKDEKKNAESN